MHLAPGEIQDYGFIQLGVKGKNTFHARVVVQRLTEEQQKQRDTYLKEKRRKEGIPNPPTRRIISKFLPPI